MNTICRWHQAGMEDIRLWVITSTIKQLLDPIRGIHRRHSIRTSLALYRAAVSNNTITIRCKCHLRTLTQDSVHRQIWCRLMAAKAQISVVKHQVVAILIQATEPWALADPAEVDPLLWAAMAVTGPEASRL